MLGLDHFNRCQVSVDGILRSSHALPLPPVPPGSSKRVALPKEVAAAIEAAAAETYSEARSEAAGSPVVGDGLSSAAGALVSPFVAEAVLMVRFWRCAFGSEGELGSSHDGEKEEAGWEQMAISGAASANGSLAAAPVLPQSPPSQQLRSPLSPLSPLASSKHPTSPLALAAHAGLWPVTVSSMAVPGTKGRIVVASGRNLVITVRTASTVGDKARSWPEK